MKLRKNWEYGEGEYKQKASASGGLFEKLIPYK
jgi:hypothetical protein